MRSSPTGRRSCSVTEPNVAHSPAAGAAYRSGLARGASVPPLRAPSPVSPLRQGSDRHRATPADLPGLYTGDPRAGMRSAGGAGFAIKRRGLVLRRRRSGVAGSLSPPPLTQERDAAGSSFCAWLGEHRQRWMRSSRRRDRRHRGARLSTKGSVSRSLRQLPRAWSAGVQWLLPDRPSRARLSKTGAKMDGSLKHSRDPAAPQPS